jgi:hypothetical protein
MVAKNAKFTNEENRFLQEEYAAENEKITELGARVMIEVKGLKVSQIDNFLNRVTAVFVRRFLYQHPRTKKSQIKPEQLYLQYDKDNWPERFKEVCLIHYAYRSVEVSTLRMLAPAQSL